MMALEGARRRLFNRNNRRVAHIILYVPGIRYLYVYILRLHCTRRRENQLENPSEGGVLYYHTRVIVTYCTVLPRPINSSRAYMSSSLQVLLL